METEPFFLDPDYAEMYHASGTFDRSQLKIDSLPHGRKGKRLVFEIAFFLVVVYLLLFNVIPFSDALTTDRTYERDGAAVDLVVTDCKMEVIRGVKESPRVYFTYTVREKTYTGAQFVESEKSCASFSADTVYPGEYLVSDPATARFDMPSDAGVVDFDLVKHVFVYGGIIAYTLYRFHIYTRAEGHYRRLKSRGEVLDGEIVEATAKFNPSGTYAGDQEGYQVKISYIITTPKKHHLQRWQSKIRNDMTSKKLPRKGTPVKVLYADDDAFVML